MVADMEVHTVADMEVASIVVDNVHWTWRPKKKHWLTWSLTLWPTRR